MINPFGMTRALISSVALLLVLGSCTQRLICPAYQSAFIYDKPTQREKFVYYNESPTQPREVLASNSKTITLPPRDSTWLKSDAMKGPALPQVRRSKKGRYLLLPEKTYKQALRSLRTVEMKPVYPKKPDSLYIKAQLDSAARSITDTLTAQGQSKPAEDTVYAITKTKEKYNMDQDIYMWYFRDVLVLPDVRAAMMEEGAAKASSQKSSKKAKGGFFKNLFKKKNKNDSTASDVVDESVVSDSTAAKPKKKLLGGLFKKKPKVDTTDPEKKADPAKKEEDDGF